MEVVEESNVELNMHAVNTKTSNSSVSSGLSGWDFF